MRKEKLSGLTIFLAVIQVIVVTIALVALAFWVVVWVIGVENMATLERFMSISSSVMVSILIIVGVLIVLILLVGLGHWLSKKDEGIKILPFEVAKGEDQYSGKAISHLLTAELLRISRIHRNVYEDVPRSIEPENLIRVIPAKAPPTPENRTLLLTSEILPQFSVTPTTALTPENLTPSIANIGVAVPGVASVSLCELLVVLKVLWPWDDTRQVITGSLQKYGSMISLVVCLEHHDVRAWDVRHRIRGQDQVADAHIPSLVRDLSFKISHDLSSEASSKTWQGLKYFTEALDAYYQYTQTTSTVALDRACKNCIKAANVEPGYERLLVLLYNLGMAYTNKGRYTEAEKLFRQAIAIKSDDLDALFGLGYMHGVQNHYDKALEYFDRTIELEPENAGFWNNKGNALIVLGKLEDARVSYEMATKLEPENAIFWYGKGNALMELSKLEDAQVSYEMAIELEPENADFWYGKGNALMELSKLEDARVSYEMAIELDSENADFWYGKGNALMKLGKLEDARVSYEMATKLDPKDAIFWYGKGNALMELSKLEDAQVSYEMAIKLDPEDAGFWYGKGNALMELSKLEDARVSYEKAIELDPENAGFWYNKGVALMELGKHEDARVSYEMAIKLEPEDADFWHNKGLALRALGRHEDARESYEKAIELDPKDPTIRTSLAALYRNLGRKNECAEQCKLARQFIKNENEYNRACFETVCGSADEALNLLRTALEKKQTTPNQARQDSDLEFLHDDPRFRALLDEFDDHDAGSS